MSFDCPKCSNKLKCIDTRRMNGEEGGFVQRRYRCDSCDHRCVGEETLYDTGARGTRAALTKDRIDNIITKAVRNALKKAHEA